MRAKFFFDGNHANSYLKDCIIRVENKPIYVFSATEKKLHYASIINMEEKQKSIDIENDAVNLVPPELGFVNTALLNTPKIFRCFRSPSRVWKIGIGVHNIVFVPYINSQIIFSQSMYNCIVGNYPSYEKARFLTETGGTCAFSRRFAINSKKEAFHFYIDEPIGLIYKEHINLYPKYYYLHEILGEDLK